MFDCRSFRCVHYLSSALCSCRVQLWSCARQSPPIPSRWVLSPSHVGTSLWALSCTSCDDECTPPPHVWPWPKRKVRPPVVSSHCHPSHKLSNACSSWCLSFPLFHLANELFLSASRSGEQSFASSLHPCFLLLFPHLQLLLVLSQLFLHCL